MSTTEYVRDPRFKVQCMAARLLPYELETTWVPGDEVDRVDALDAVARDEGRRIRLRIKWYVGQSAWLFCRVSDSG